MKKPLLISPLKYLLFGIFTCLSTITFAQRQTVGSSFDFGATSLRSVVADANAGDTIDFGPLVLLPIMLTDGPITIDKALVIEGSALIEVSSSAAAPDQLFIINNADSVSFINITLSGGASDVNGGAIEATNTNIKLVGVEINGCSASGVGPKEGGGAIYINAGDLSISMNSNLSDNTADGESGSGGAILLDNGANLRIEDSELSNNTASRAGGAIESNTGGGTVVEIINSILNNNETGPMPGNGGALHITGMGNATILSSTFNGNIAAAEGGALWNGAGEMLIDSTNIDGNVANGEMADQGGAGIYNLSGVLNVQNSSITNNIADFGSASGGGVLNDAGAMLSVSNSSIQNNSAQRAGGGIEDNSGATTTILLNNINLDNNTTGAVPGNGGGLHITGPGNANIIGGTVSGNVAAAEGGGLWNGSGVMNIDGTSIRNNEARGLEADQGGAGVYNLSGTLNIINSIIADNFADSASASGGGILNDVGATLSVSNTRIQNNRARRAGGGIEDNSGVSTVVKLTNVNLDSNSVAPAPGNGGGFHVTGEGIVIINGGTVNGNIAFAEGGGLWNGSGSMLVSNVDINGNEAQGLMANQGGGAIYNLSGTLNVIDSELTGNIADSASASGGGILNDVGATLVVSNTVFRNNRAKRAGGAIEDVSGNISSISIFNSTFNANTVGAMPGNGGAVHITGDGNLDFENCTFISNVASAEGGAVWNGSGIMNISGSSFVSNVSNGSSADQGGGALYNLSGVVNITGSAFSNNTANTGSGSGGAILNDAGATLNIDTTVFVANSANRAGGAIEDNSGSTSIVTISEVSFSENNTGSTPGNGGAIHITGNGVMTISNSTSIANTAANEGGAFWNGSGSMQVISNRFENNVSNGSGSEDGGGAIFNNGGLLSIENSSLSNNIAAGAEASGGAIANVGGRVALINSTVSGNTANNFGGGFYNRGAASIENSSIVLNEAKINGGGFYQNTANDSAFFVENLLALNIAPTGINISLDSGFVLSGDYNLVGVNNNGQFPNAGNDQIGSTSAPINPRLMLLQDNGGNTLTHSFLDGSLALNMANPNNQNTDQIGQAVFGGRKDVGAFECQTCSAVGINNNIAQAEIATIYPNPSFNDVLKINSLNEKEVKVTVVNNAGKTLINRSGNGLIELNTSALPKGSYLIKIQSGINVQVSRIVKM